MKNLSFSVALAIALGGLVAGVVNVFPYAKENETAWFMGALAASLLGGVVVVLKAKLVTPDATQSSAAALKAVLSAQVVGLLSRIAVVGVGAALVKTWGFEPIAFVVSFFLVSLAQQGLEMRSLLAARSNPVKPVKSSEVTP